MEKQIKVLVKMSCFYGLKLIEPEAIIMIDAKDFNAEVFKKISDDVKEEKPKQSKSVNNKDEDVI